MDSAQIIATYEVILDVTGQMLEAARSSDWDRLQELEIECRALVGTLKSASPHMPLNAEEQQRKAEIICGVLADDAEIRNLTQGWMGELERFLGSAGYHEKLQQAYGTNPER